MYIFENERISNLFEREQNTVLKDFIDMPNFLDMKIENEKDKDVACVLDIYVNSSEFGENTRRGSNFTMSSLIEDVYYAANDSYECLDANEEFSIYCKTISLADLIAFAEKQDSLVYTFDW